MLRIRFFRTGKKHQPFFRIVVTDKRNPPQGGRFLEVVGFFNPFTKEKKLRPERIKHWLSVGAQPSDRVHNLLVGEGIVKEKKKPVHAKTKKKEEKPPASAPPTGAAPAGKEEKPKAKPEPKPADAKPKEEKPAPEKPEPKPEPKKEEPTDVKKKPEESK